MLCASYIQHPSADLALPPTLVDLIEVGAFDALSGFGGFLRTEGIRDTPLAKATGGSDFLVERRPFTTYARWAGPSDVDSPEVRLLAAIHARGSETDYIAGLQQAHRDNQDYMGLELLEPALAVAIGSTDPDGYPTVILDYRDDPPSVRRHVQRTLDSPADWVLVARTFDDFVDMVGLNVNGPLYWLPYENGATIDTVGDQGGVIRLDHHHPLGPRITAEVISRTAWTITSWLGEQRLHVRRLSRRYWFDITGPMKRALAEMAIAGVPQSLRDQYTETFSDENPAP